MLDALPDEVDVHYNPATPQEAYLRTNTPRWDYVMAAGGVIGLLGVGGVVLRPKVTSRALGAGC
jgi:hypothetical protein